MELRTGWWDGFEKRWQRGSMWLADEACFLFVCVPTVRVEGSFASRIEVRSYL
jgi:hypothetical protein